MNALLVTIWSKVRNSYWKVDDRTMQDLDRLYRDLLRMRTDQQHREKARTIGQWVPSRDRC